MHLALWRLAAKCAKNASLKIFHLSHGFALASPLNACLKCSATTRKSEKVLQFSVFCAASTSAWCAKRRVYLVAEDCAPASNSNPVRNAHIIRLTDTEKGPY